MVYPAYDILSLRNVRLQRNSPRKGSNGRSSIKALGQRLGGQRCLPDGDMLICGDARTPWKARDCSKSMSSRKRDPVIVDQASVGVSSWFRQIRLEQSKRMDPRTFHACYKTLVVLDERKMYLHSHRIRGISPTNMRPQWANGSRPEL